MKRSLCGLAIACATLLAGQLAASPSEHLNHGSQLNAAQCNTAGAKMIINVVQQVTNDVDSGLGGNWAFDNYNRHIQVWQLDANHFCAVLKYQGSFTTIAGRSPGNTDDIAAGITGTFEGGYQTTVFTGTLKSTPDLPTRGNIGTFDYGCNVAGTCPGRFFWGDKYFSSIGGDFDLAWWGWIYHGGNNGSWVNASSGNSGDIID